LHVTLPMMRNIIAITVLFSLIVTFANFDIVQIMTAGGPRNMTHVFATYAFLLGIRSGDLPLGAAVSLFMFPILAVSAVFILRGGRKRGREMGCPPRLPSTRVPAAQASNAAGDGRFLPPIFSSFCSRSSFSFHRTT